MGLLRIDGEIELDQFWPQGSSDADTTKIKVKVGEDSFFFAPDGVTFRPTRVFHGAKVVGTQTGPLIKNDRITVRLQGIDAPELHYRASGLRRSEWPDLTEEQRERFNTANRPERRQYWGETATIALADKLANFGAGSIPCQVVSFVDLPKEVPDTYARVVGNIRIGSGFTTDINLWLAGEGWVIPTFYWTMSADEIGSLTRAAAAGKRKRRAFAALDPDTRKFDPALVYRGKGVDPDPEADKGPVLLPKLFRRALTFHALKKARLARGSFPAYLKSKASSNVTLKLDEYLEQGKEAPTYGLHEFLQGPKLAVSPLDIVFKEKFSTLRDAEGNDIVNWF